jgi:hypothetical protein
VVAAVSGAAVAGEAAGGSAAGSGADGGVSGSSFSAIIKDILFEVEADRAGGAVLGFGYTARPGVRKL